MEHPTVEDAKKIAEKYNKDGVIVFHINFSDRDKKAGWGYASYGSNKALCQATRKLADQMADSVFKEGAE
jgi:hypothetical protein